VEEMMKTVDLLIFGTGGFSKEVNYLIKKINAVGNSVHYNIVGFVGKHREEIGNQIFDGQSIVASDDTVESFISGYPAIGLVISFADCDLKEKVYKNVGKISNVFFPNLIHPDVIFESEVKMGIGNIITAGVIITAETAMGDFNLVNLNSTIGHDTVLGSFNTINPLTAISGNVTIKDNCLIGTGASILQNLTVEDHARVGAGAVVTKNVGRGITVTGVPARERSDNKMTKGTSNKAVFIIAEAGVNHNGDTKTAFQMVDAAKAAGADAIKFQTFKAEEGVSKFASKAEYQINNTQNQESQLEMVKKLELSYDSFQELYVYCQDRGIQFLSTPFDFLSIEFLHTIDMPVWKVPSGEITNLPYLIKIAEIHKPVILSTGMSNLEEIEYAVKILRDNGAGEITLLHCNTEYPTPFEDANLRAILTLKEKFHFDVGYSDHTPGIEAAIAAVALGATVIEKHFTLDKNMDGPDHKASLEPDELKQMVDSIRKIELALGNGVKEPTKSEWKNRDIARKSIVARRDIQRGESFSEHNITVKRPGNGISPVKWFDVIGQTAKRDFQEDELIEL